MELLVSAIPGMLADAVPICYAIVPPPGDKEELTCWYLRVLSLLHAIPGENPRPRSSQM